MDNNYGFNGSNNNGNQKLFELLGLGGVAFGTLLIFIFNIVVCSRGDDVFKDSIKDGDFKSPFGMSLAIIGVIIGVIFVIAGLVLTILSLGSASAIMDIANLSMIVKITLVVAAVALFFAIVPNLTICSYNCSLNSQFKNFW